MNYYPDKKNKQKIMASKYSDINNIKEEYSQVYKIGQGSYGSVFKIVKKKTKEFFACKKISTYNLPAKERSHLFNEIRIINNVVCPYIINYENVFYENKYVYIVTNYCSYGELSKLILYYKHKNR